LPTANELYEELPLYGKRRLALEELEWRIEETFKQYSSQYEFAQGAKALKPFLSFLSVPTDPRKIRLKARVHHYIAWFSIQQGKSRSAHFHGMHSIFLSREAYKETGSKVDLDRYVEAALIISMAAHLSAEARDRYESHSLTILNLAADAAREAKNPRGSEHFRQRGSALFNLGDEEGARKYFEQAMERARVKNEARDENHVEMIGKRFLNVLGKFPNWDGAQELLKKVERTFGKKSLEYVINLNYAAAAGLLTGDFKIERDAVELLRSNNELVLPFGRQATVSKLLLITPDLKITDPERRRWIKQALRANALRKF
jgi:tetratricopeptide (TPR) repeat protein